MIELLCFDCVMARWADFNLYHLVNLLFILVITMCVIYILWVIWRLVLIIFLMGYEGWGYFWQGMNSTGEIMCYIHS